MTWQNNAQCKGQTHLFFSKRPSERTKAHKLCKTCPVQTECYNEAIELSSRHLVFGIWADTTQAYRESITGRNTEYWFQHDQ